MDIECIVCGSPHNQQALRCVVCGADLPGSGGEGRTQGYALDLPQPLQTLNPAVLSPPVSGSGEAEERSWIGAPFGLSSAQGVAKRLHL